MAQQDQIPQLRLFSRRCLQSSYRCTPSPRHLVSPQISQTCMGSDGQVRLHFVRMHDFFGSELIPSAIGRSFTDSPLDADRSIML